IGFNKSTYYIDTFKKLNKKLNKYNITIYMVRGNHDDPSYFDNRKYGNIICLSDYSIIRNNNNNILCIGGAISIDRRSRIAYDKRQLSIIKRYTTKVDNIKKTYWDNEAPIYNDIIIKEIKKNCDINVIVSHTSPGFCYPMVKAGIEYELSLDVQLEEDLTLERSIMTSIYNEFKDTVVKYVYGHFHKTNIEYIDNTKFVCLDCVQNYIGLKDNLAIEVI
ncbi:MAG: metallophosphoesterase, partial [Clostridia bacterium]